MTHSLRLRLFLTLLAVVLVAVLTTALFANRGTTYLFRRYLMQNSEHNEQAIAELLARHSEQSDIQSVQFLAEEIEEVYGLQIELLENGDVIASSSPQLIGRVDFVHNLDEEQAPTVTVAGRPVTVFIQPATPAPDAAASSAVAYTSFPVDFTLRSSDDVLWVNGAEADLVGSVNRSFMIAASAALALTLVLGFGLSRRILHPIEALTAATRRMEKGDLSQRVAVNSKDEIGELGAAFNQMADSLTQLEQLRRNLVTDVAHELRTPLANVRGYLEAIQDGVIAPTEATLGSIYEETMLLNHLVSDLQEISLAEAGQLRLDLKAASISEVVNQAIMALQPQLKEKTNNVEVRIPDDCPPVWADHGRVGQVLRNLLGNAITHSPEGATIIVKAEYCDSEVVISVQDSGDGIPNEHLPYIFDRFYRADKSRDRATGGIGLGLTIVKGLVEAHNGQVRAENLPEKGARFAFSLPVAPV